MDRELAHGTSGMPTAQPIRFSPEEACWIVGVSPDSLSMLAGRDLGGSATFTLADIVGLAAAAELRARADIDLQAFADGLNSLFQALAASPDVERLDRMTAVLGPRMAELWSSDDLSVRMTPAGSVTVPLGPLLASLRDLVFA